ncbi:trypsin-like peptidase domain-containing protein [Candidatus Wolfebacteria bacterium]|nr:trypsin-like peptidase domain-containing protein [Candidatus Wolfebacteria bacterium]
MNKKIFILIVLSALIGWSVGFFAPANNVKAGFFNDFYDNYLKPSLEKIPKIIPEKESGKETKVESKKEEQKGIYAPTIDYEQAVIKAIETASPAVISIVISKYLPVVEQCPYNPFSDLPEEFQQFFGQGFGFSQPCQKGTKKQEIGGGSGFIISSDGMIVTNKHVVSDEKAEYTVLTNDSKKYKAKILARDSIRDFAVLKISANNLPVVQLGNSDAIKLGQTAIAIGNALGEFRNTVSVGIVSGLSRNIMATGGGMTEKIEGLIQTDAAINQGNSGGPLLNLKGEVIGINVAMVSGAQNIGFAIPVNQVKKSIESVKKTGRIVVPYIGVRYLMITAEMAKKEKLPVESGAIVRGNEDGPGVIKDSPADKSGIQAEDIILEINNEKISSEKPLISIVQKYGVNDEIILKILRDGKEMEVKVKLEERPKE